MAGIYRVSYSGAAGTRELDGVNYDCLHTLSLDTVGSVYSTVCSFGIPFKVDGSANTSTVITTAKKRQDLGYQRETIRAEFPMKMGAAAIKTAIKAWVTNCDTATIFGITPGISESVVSLFNAGVDVIVNPIASSTAITELSDPEQPVRV